ncbi:hypothetical protein EX30DRAFT_351800 [Ascodesmis nigricans]|uniref:Uncharacterized protein n=1 Tax=Ascodesmis nigricans TaxID=341454 RepID=A0A4S2MKM0_9PEZI|nr:hypothetical protein EX30DRAFT_351800 [Ascodesmis nigricans]
MGPKITSRKTKKQAREEIDISPRNRTISAERRIIIERKNEKEPCPAAELVVAMNAAPSKANAPAHIRIQKVEENEKGTVTARTGPKATGLMALNFKETLMKAARGVDNNVEQMKANETWHKLKLHAVSLNRYYHPDNNEEAREKGLSQLKKDIENAYPEIDLPLKPRWLLHPERLRERANSITHSTAIITLRSGEDAERIRKEGLWIYGKQHTIDKYIQGGPDAFCEICCGWGHGTHRCERAEKPACLLCGSGHRTKDHKCREERKACLGRSCRQLVKRCCNCGGAHTLSQMSV